jgi:hypothetical protein
LIATTLAETEAPQAKLKGKTLRTAIGTEHFSAATIGASEPLQFANAVV